MEGSTSKDSGLGINPKIIFVFLWVASICIVAFVSFAFGKNKNTNITANAELTPAISPTSAPIAQQNSNTNEQATVLPVPTETVDLESFCDKTGPSQKKDYLVAYTIQDGDTISSIAEKQLGSTTRDAEIIQLNDNLSKVTVGSVLYLPPPSIKESSGKLFEVSGKIVKRDNANWQLSYGGGSTGPGIVIPAFWFKDVPNLDSYKLGDCVTVFLDNGVKVYTIKKS